MKSNQLDFIHYTEIIFFWVKHNEYEYVLLFSEFYDVKTETSIRWKVLFDKQCPLAQDKKSGNKNKSIGMAANVFSQNGYMYNKYLLFLFLIQGRTHCLRFSFLLYVLDSVTNSLQQLLTIPSVCYVCHL